VPGRSRPRPGGVVVNVHVVYQTDTNVKVLKTKGLREHRSYRSQDENGCQTDLRMRRKDCFENHVSKEKFGTERIQETIDWHRKNVRQEQVLTSMRAGEAYQVFLERLSLEKKLEIIDAWLEQFKTGQKGN